MKNVPFLITIFFAIGGWLVTHLADRLLTAPIISYSICEEKHSNGTIEAKYIIENISRNVSFKKFEIQIICRRGEFIYFNKIFYPPLICDEDKIIQPAKNEVQIPIPELQPNEKIGIILCHNGTNLTLYYSTPNSQSILLKRRGVETLIIKYEIFILLAFILIWLIVITIYLYFISRENKTETKITLEWKEVKK